ncbi:MAG: hypothetical protein OQK12_13635 [Motiliproteus sp.]|nr:hypothetical protein [Motiliproteus sp.]
MTKAFQWKHLEPDVVIIGNSRPELGIDPESPQFGNKSVYNLGLRGAGVTTQAIYLINLLNHHNPERVILNVDFLDFLQNPNKTVAWPPVNSSARYLELDLFGDKVVSEDFEDIEAKLKSLITLDVTLASFKTLFLQNHETNFTTQKGFNNAEGFKPIVKSEGTAALFEQKIQELSKRLSGKKYSLYDQNGVSKSFLTLNYLIGELHKKNIHLDIFISPYHDQYLQVVEETGHMDLFLSWKKELAIHLEKTGYFENSELYDFSDMNDFIKEPIPDKKGEFMKWYWEPAHYTARLGEEILSLLSQKKTTSDSLRTDGL